MVSRINLDLSYEHHARANDAKTFAVGWKKRAFEMHATDSSDTSPDMSTTWPYKNWKSISSKVIMFLIRSELLSAIGRWFGHNPAGTTDAAGQSPASGSGWARQTRQRDQVGADVLNERIGEDAAAATATAATTTAATTTAATVYHCQSWKQCSR